MGDVRMPKLWLTYAWKDNEDADVDFVIQSLERRGVEVQFDRVQLQTGRRLWDSIDNGITDPCQSDAWAIFVTKNSLQSEPCLEELAYALDRALRARGGSFPLIGIFPSTMDRELIPSAIATRLWVKLSDPHWADQIASDLNGLPKPKPADIPPFLIKFHNGAERLILELRPRAGRWYPAVVAVPKEEQHLATAVLYGPSGQPPRGCAVTTSYFEAMDNATGSLIAGRELHHAITNDVSMYAYFSDDPSLIIFGSNEELYRLDRKKRT